MELCSYKTLANYIKEEVGPQRSHALKIMKQITQALGYVHSEGIMHRDVKVTVYQ